MNLLVRSSSTSEIAIAHGVSTLCCDSDASSRRISCRAWAER